MAAGEAVEEAVVAAEAPSPNPDGAVLDPGAGADVIKDTPEALNPEPKGALLVAAAAAGEAVVPSALNPDPKLALDAAGADVLVAAGDSPAVRPEPKIGLDEGAAGVLALKPDPKTVLLGAAAGVADETGLPADAEGELSLPKTLPAFVCGLPAVGWEAPESLPCPKRTVPGAPSEEGNAIGAVGEGCDGPACWPKLGEPLVPNAFEGGLCPNTELPGELDCDPKLKPGLLLG